MKKHSKRYQKLKEQINSTNQYAYSEAISLLKNLACANFIESAEVHVCLNINPKFTNQQLRANLNLPHGNGKESKIAVFGEFENQNEILKLGVHKMGNDDLAEEIAKGILDFDILITTPAYMPKLAKFGKILGPKGLMPSPKAGTVSLNLTETIKEFKGGKLEYRADKSGIVHLGFGKLNFSENKLEENLYSVYLSLVKNKPSGVKGKYFRSFFVSSTMSPSIQIDINSFKHENQ